MIVAKFRSEDVYHFDAYSHHELPDSYSTYVCSPWHEDVIIGHMKHVDLFS